MNSKGWGIWHNLLCSINMKELRWKYLKLFGYCLINLLSLSTSGGVWFLETTQIPAEKCIHKILSLYIYIEWGNYSLCIKRLLERETYFLFKVINASYQTLDLNLHYPYSLFDGVYSHTAFMNFTTLYMRRWDYPCCSWASLHSSNYSS